MKKETVTLLIKDFHERPLPRVIERHLELRLTDTKKAITIIGPRRAGKTYFLFDNMMRLKDVEKSKMLFINLEDDRLLPLDLSDLDEFLRTYYEIYPENRKERMYLFLDEIQNVDGWETFVRRILDQENIMVFVTGSSSKLLSKEIATSMRGRSTTYLMLPFSFGEFLKVREFEIEEYLSSAKKSWMMKYLDEYIRFGGFPEIILDDDEVSRVRTLKEYVEIMLMRDVVERHNVKNTKVLRMLFNALLSSLSKEFSVHKFFNFLKSQGIKVSKNTLYEYFQHFEDAFAVLPVRRFSYSIRGIEQSLPKVYQIDNGYAAQLGLRFSENTGQLLENVMAVELFRRTFQNPKLEFYYWKSNSGKEVDFVLKEGKDIIELIQACYNIDDWETKIRETKALITAGEELDCKHLRIITWDQEGEETTNGKQIIYIPLWKWLLGMR
jgi:predicted AAA+ superfamily ATPase